MKIRTKHQILVKIWQDCALARENDIDFENYHPNELHKSLQKFFVQVGKHNFVIVADNRRWRLVNESWRLVNESWRLLPNIMRTVNP